MSRERPARPDLEHYRKEAKALVRAFREADGAALRRAEAVLGRRARKRFALSDAQYVIAVEHGYASWAELRRACEQTGLTDRSNAVRLAGKPRGWLDVAERVVEEFSLNVNRRGVVLVGTVYPDWVETARVADRGRIAGGLRGAARAVSG